MAINTRNRRASIIEYGKSIGRVLPNPDGTIGTADRQQLAFQYPGIPPTPPPVGSGIIGSLPRMNVGS